MVNSRIEMFLVFFEWFNPLSHAPKTQVFNKIDFHFEE
jgi:hypothetical protein